jgi:Na+-driven multidrug efflux pump
LGVAGIALSTSFVYMFSFFFLLFFVLRNLKSMSIAPSDPIPTDRQLPVNEEID